MLIHLAKRALRNTPYDIVRRKPPQGEFDAVAHNSLSEVDATFSDEAFLAKYVNPTRLRFYESTKQIVLNNIDPQSCKTVGDFGCGIGAFLKVLLPEFDHCALWGYDFSNATISAAKRGTPNATFEQYDLYTPPPRQHDLTICSQTLEHLLEPQLALKHLVMATKPGGLLLLTVPDGRTDTFKGHLQFWSPESWNAWVKRHLDGEGETLVMQNGTMGGNNLAAIIRPR